MVTVCLSCLQPSGWANFGESTAFGVTQAQRFPLPGMSVVCDTRVYTGRSALWYAAGCRLIALALMGMTIVMYGLIRCVIQMLNQLIVT